MSIHHAIPVSVHFPSGYCSEYLGVHMFILPPPVFPTLMAEKSFKSQACLGHYISLIFCRPLSAVFRIKNKSVRPKACVTWSWPPCLNHSLLISTFQQNCPPCMAIGPAVLFSWPKRLHWPQACCSVSAYLFFPALLDPPVVDLFNSNLLSTCYVWGTVLDART